MATKILTPIYSFPHQLGRAFFCMLPFLIAPLFIGTAILHKEASYSTLGAFVLALPCGVGVALLLACGIAWMIKRFYKHVHFKILNDRVEYSRDFIALQLKDLKYRNVKEITLTRGPLQKIVGLGTILLQSHASPQQVKGGTSGLRIYNIENSEKIYAFLKKKVDEADV